jgi:glycosyltransferase involved in cell wall biosynthesis
VKILFVCRFLPHSKARDSGRQDTYHYISSLSQSHDVSVIAFVPDEDRQGIPELETLCRRVIAVPYEHDRLLSRIWRAAGRLVMARVYGRNLSINYRKRLQYSVSDDDFDVFIVDGPMAPYNRLLSGGLCLLDEVDIYSEVAHHEFLQENHFFKRWWAKFDWRRTSSAELNFIGKADGVLVRSQKDKNYLKERLPHQEIIILPPWFEGLAELRQVELRRPEGNIVLFVGALAIPVNQEAVIYFAREVFPLIKGEISDATLIIVGSQPDSRVRALDSLSGVMVVGEVEALAPYYQKAAVNVVPLMTGGGIIVKTLNGLASGRPTVASPAGNSGTGARDGEHLLLVEGGPEEFARSVQQILKDDELWNRLAKAGRAYIEQTFDWDTIIREFEDFLEKMTQKHG